jgi:nitroreductase
MLLAASELGFGTLWFTWFEPDRLRAVLNVPENLEIAAVVPIGLPKDSMKAPPRKEPKIHRERYQKAE